MRMTTGKRLVAALAVAVLAVTTACSSAPGGGGGNSEKVVTVWHTESTPATKAAMDEIIADYQAAHPGVKIIQENVSAADLPVKLQAGLAAGDLPEVTHVEPMYVRTLYEQGLLAPVDEVVKSLDGDLMPYLKKLFELDGHDYGITHAWGVDTITYRADLYAKADAGTPDQATTWDEANKQMLAVAKANPGTVGLALVGSSAHNLNEDVYMWLGSNGGKLWDEAGRASINTPQMVEVLENWVNLRKSGVIGEGWTSATYSDSLGALARGEAGTVFSFGRATYTFEEQAPDLKPGKDINVSPIRPIGPSGTDWITQLDAEPFVVFKDSPNAAEAIEFLKFFYQRDNYLKWVGSVPTQLLSVRPSLFDDAEWKNLPAVQKWGFWIETQRTILESGRARPLMATSMEDLRLPYLTDLYGSGILGDMVLDVVEKGVPAAEAAAAAQARADELLGPQYKD